MPYVFTGRTPRIVDGEMRHHGDRLPDSIGKLRHLSSLTNRGLVTWYPAPEPGARPEPEERPAARAARPRKRAVKAPDGD